MTSYFESQQVFDQNYGSGDLVVESDTTTENAAVWQSTTASNDVESNVEIMCRAQSMCVSMTSEFMNDLWPGAQIENLHFEELCDDYSLSVSDSKILITF